MHLISKPRKPKGSDRYLRDGERQRLLEACKASDTSWLYTIVVLALSTGCRKMELLSLHWTDVDLSRGTITLPDTKNGDTRTVLLVGTALEVMREHARVRRIDTNLVFRSAHGRQRRDIGNPWYTARRQAGLRDFVFHDLRHSTGSYLAMSGASPRDIAEILGHKDLKTSMKYVHLSQQHTTAVSERMSQAFLMQT